MLTACFATALVASCATPARARHFSSGCGSSNGVALTFDDGPNPPYTDQILALLSAAGARATFFDEGKAVEAHPEIVRDELARGMAVGSHSYAHGTDLPDLSNRAFRDDLRQAEDALVSTTGMRPYLYRSPFGHTSTVMLEEERKRGYVSIGWDVDSGDWSDASADAVVSNVLDHARAGSIVLMHDGGLSGGNPDRSITISALPRIIDGLRGRGFDLVTVPELIGTPDASGRIDGAC